MMVGAGIDADVVRLVHAAREENYRRQTKKGAHISYLSYLKPIFQSTKTYSYPQIRTEILPVSNATAVFDVSNAPDVPAPGATVVPVAPEKPRKIVGKWSFVFNLPRYGWGLPLVPKCVGVDGKLDYCIFQGGKLALALVDVFFAQLGSSHRFLPNAKLGQGVRFRLVADGAPSDAAPIPYQLDGDPGGFLPVEIETIPNRFTVVAPPKIVAKLSRRRR